MITTGLQMGSGPAARMRLWPRCVERRFQDKPAGGNTPRQVLRWWIRWCRPTATGKRGARLGEICAFGLSLWSRQNIAMV